MNPFEIEGDAPLVWYHSNARVENDVAGEPEYADTYS
jgi:hypothetical protein